MWFSKKKTHTYTPRRSPTIHIWCRMYSVSYTIGNPENVFWPSDLDLWPMTLTFGLGLDILPLDLHTEIQVCMSIRLAVRVVTHRQTDRHTDDVKTIAPDTSQCDLGCNNLFCLDSGLRYLQTIISFILIVYLCWFVFRWIHSFTNYLQVVDKSVLVKRSFRKLLHGHPLPFSYLLKIPVFFLFLHQLTNRFIILKACRDSFILDYWKYLHCVKIIHPCDKQKPTNHDTQIIPSYW